MLTHIDTYEGLYNLIKHIEHIIITSKYYNYLDNQIKARYMEEQTSYLVNLKRLGLILYLIHISLLFKGNGTMMYFLQNI